MQKWEYRILICRYDKAGGTWFVDDVKMNIARQTRPLVVLNAFGEEGWELISREAFFQLEPVVIDVERFYFKRPLEAPAQPKAKKVDPGKKSILQAHPIDPEASSVQEDELEPDEWPVLREDELEYSQDDPIRDLKYTLGMDDMSDIDFETWLEDEEKD